MRLEIVHLFSIIKCRTILNNYVFIATQIDLQKNWKRVYLMVNKNPKTQRNELVVVF